MYWTDYFGNDIRRANLDGTGQKTLVTGLSTPVGIALDFSAGLMYWAERGGFIRRANLDGSGQQILVQQAGDAVGIALVLSAGLMYWGDGTGSIQRANLDGSGTRISLPVKILLEAWPWTPRLPWRVPDRPARPLPL
jgi:hypothetical protein